MTTTTPPKPQDGEMPDVIYLIHHADGEGEHAWSTDPDPTGFIQENEVTKYIKEASIAEGLPDDVMEFMRDAIIPIMNYCGNSYSNAWCERLLTIAKNYGAYSGNVTGNINDLRDSMIKEAGRE